jgi:maleate isomerase
MDIRENFQIAQVPGARIVEFARATVGDLQPDALFVSCTNFPAMSVLGELLSMFPFPVLTSNQCALEAALEVAGGVAAEARVQTQRSAPW